MAKFGIGQPVRRVEDQRFLTGQGRYVDDIVLPGMLHGLQRAVAARPRQDQEGRRLQGQGRARRAAGADRRRRRRREARRAHLAPDAGGFRRAQGPPHLPAAAASATASATSATASPSSSPRRWRRRATPPSWSRSTTSRCRRVVNIEDAAKPDAPKVWDDNPDGNNAFRLMFGNKEATDAAFAKRQARRQAPRREQPPVARLDGAARRDRRLRRRDRRVPRSTAPRRIRTARAWRSRTSSTCRRTSIRVVSPDVGGGFGLKGGFVPRGRPRGVGRRSKLRRPVKWVSTRSEAMLNDHHAREMVYYGELALDEHGKILGAALASRCSRWAPISSARRSPPARSRSASCPPPTTSRPCTSCRRACSPTPRRAGPIAAPAARRPPTSWSG